MASSEHKLSNGQMFTIVTTTGTVLSTRRDHKLQIHQSAATLSPHGAVLPGEVTSTSRSRQEVWIKTEDGKEVAVMLNRFTVPVREGQQISVAAGAPTGASKEVVFAIRNHTAETSEGAIAPMRAALEDWKLEVGARASVARWALVPALLCGGLVFFKMDPSGDRPIFAAIAAGVAGVLGVSAWLNFGSAIGTKARTDFLLREVKELGLRELVRVGE